MSVFYFFRLFKISQPHIRTLLQQLEKPPDLKDESDPLKQTICHLLVLKKNKLCPAARFQFEFQSDFLIGTAA